MVNTFENACIVGHNIYFFSYEVNGLFEIDMNKRKCSYITSLKKYNSKIRLFGDLTYINGKIVMAPTIADDFVVYDLERKTTKYLAVQKNNNCYIRHKFFAVIPFGTSAYFIGHWYPAIARLNLENDEITYYSDWCEEIGKDFFRHDYCIKDNKIILSCSNTNKVMIFDMDNGSHYFVEVGTKKRKYAGILFDGKKYWLTPRSDNVIVRWNESENDCKEIVIEDIDCTKGELSYAQSFQVNQYVIILPLYDYPVCVIDTITEKLITINSEWAIKKNYLMLAPIRGGFVYNNELYISNSYNSKLYVLDFDDMCFKETEIDTSEVFEYCINNKYIFENLKIDLEEDILIENSERDLRGLIISLNVHEIKCSLQKDNKVGDRIWNDLII